MEMRAGTPAGAACNADPLARPHVLTRMYERTREMCVQRRVAVAVFDRDDGAVAVITRHEARENDDTVRRGAHVERLQDPDVEAGMPAVAVAAERRSDRPLCRPLERQLPAGVGMCGRSRR